MIRIYRGDTISIALELYLGNVSYNIAEDEILVFTLKKEIGDAEPVILQKTFKEGVISLAHADTCDLDCGKYHCDVRLYNADKSKVYTPIVDVLEICEVVNNDV